jgi:hypothetical protein
MFAHKIMGLQSHRSPNFKKIGTPKTKSHLGAGPRVGHKEYYNGEGGGFPQVRVVVSLVSMCMPMARPCTKSATTMHQPTCCLVCASMCE